MKDHRTTETKFLDIMGDYMTGGTYSIIKWVWAIIFNVNTMLLMVFLRKNMGTHVAKVSSWIFASTWLWILFFLSVFTAQTDPATGQIIDTTYSAPIIFMHGVFFLIFSIWRKIGAWLNLRASGKKGTRIRHSYSIGESVVYPLLRWLLKPLGIIDDEWHPKTFWKLTEDRWIQWWEPTILFASGYYLADIGYGTYGQFIMFASACLWMATFRAYNNSAKVRQAQTDAHIMGQMIEPEAEAIEENPHIIGG